MARVYFAFFNRTDAIRNGYWQICMAIMLIEIFLLVISILYSILAIYMMLKTMRHQKNIRNVLIVITFIYIVSAIGRGLQAGLVLNGIKSRGHYLSPLLLCTSYVRSYCLYTTLLALPTIVVERCVATILLSYYEKKQRTAFGYSLILVLLISAAAAAYTSNTGSSTFVHFVVVVATNSLSFLINAIHYKLNENYYKEARNRHNARRKYSLSERYQIAENIRVCLFVKHTVFWAALLNLTSAICLIVSNFNVSELYHNIAILIFNYLALIYGFAVPLTIYCHNEKWQSELKRLKIKVCGETRLRPRQVSVKSSMGGETHVELSKHSDVYFNMLNEDLA